MKKKAISTACTEGLRTFALGFPETEEGASCTRSAFKARKKGFLFMGEKEESFDIMVKLGPSLPEAEKLAKREPDVYKIGIHGWVTVTFALNADPPVDLLERWIEESFQLLAPKKLVAMRSADEK